MGQCLIIVQNQLSIAMSLCSVMAMALVVCHHLPTHPQGGILEWGVPWFYFASGFWYDAKPRKWNAEILKRARTLLVPYFLLNAIWFPILFLANWAGWKYLGAERVVDGSAASIIRCLGFNPWAWPALVPTWFLRALFVASIGVAGIWSVLDAEVLKGRKPRIVLRALTALVLWSVVLMRHRWCPADGNWADFFVFGVPLYGMACFALGGFASTVAGIDCSHAVHPFVVGIRRHLMPVYVLHAIVIVVCGWIARVAGLYERLLTINGDVAMWIVGVAGALLLGEEIRRCSPRFAELIFGGR